MIDIDGILKLLPHRYPFLMIDRVVEVSPGESAVAIKNVSINEPHFAGHRSCLVCSSARLLLR